MQSQIVTKESASIQNIDYDSFHEQGALIKPFINFKLLLELYYQNIYHQRAMKLKASLLSNLVDDVLSKYLPRKKTPKNFLYSFILDLEIYGNSFIEKSGTASNYTLYNMLGYEGRVDKDGEIYQLDDKRNIIPLEGYHLYISSPKSKFYGEPDYLTTILQIATSQKTDIYNSKFFDNGAKPDLAVIFENNNPTKEQMDSFTKFFGSDFKGINNSHKTLIASTGVNDKEINNPAKIRFEELGKVEDLSFKDLKAVIRDEVIASHGVPPRLVGVMNAGGLGGGGELIGQLHMFNELVITPKKSLIEEFFYSIGIKLELKDFDVSSYKDDSAILTNLVSAGILTPIEEKEIVRRVDSGELTTDLAKEYKVSATSIRKWSKQLSVNYNNIIYTFEVKINKNEIIRLLKFKSR